MPKINAATVLAPTTRDRDGSRAKVTMAVRWLHSLVTSRMPSTGSSSDCGVEATER